MATAQLDPFTLDVVPSELTVVDGFTTTHDGQDISGLDIWCENNPLIINHRVVGRWFRVHHRHGMGMRINAGGSESRLSDFSVEHVSPPEGTDPFPDFTDEVGQVNIYGYQAEDVRLDRFKLSHGASGLYLQECDNFHASIVEGGPTHGPFPRGQFYQQNECNNCSLTIWSADNPVDASHPEDIINIYASLNAYVGPGLAKGNNAGDGVAVMFEQGSTGLCEGVDAIEMWNGAFSAFHAGTNASFVGVRTRDNYPPGENPGGRTGDHSESTSNGATFVAGMGGTASLEGKYFNVSNPGNIKVEYEGGTFSDYVAIEENFTPRAAVSVDLPDWPAFDVPPEPEPSPNLWADSAVPSNAAWNKVGVTVSAGTGDDGSDAVRETAVTGEHYFSRVQTKEAGVFEYAAEITLKPQGRTRIIAYAFENTDYAGGVIGYFFLQDTPYAVGAYFGSVMATPAVSVTDAGDGFLTCRLTFDSAPDTAMPVIFYLSAADYEQSHAGSTSAGFDVKLLALMGGEEEGPFDEPDPWTVGDWEAGSNTVLSIAGDRARLTRNNGNPRIKRQVTGLTPGQTYRVQTNGYLETATSLFFRIGYVTDPDLSFGNIKNIGGVGPIDETFTAPADGIVNIGFVAVASNNTQYAETDANFVFSEA